MKKMLVLFLLFFALYSCDHDSNSPVNPVDQLPPATQIGANTFGCLLDGEVFKPGNAPNSLNCVYQFVDGEYYFVLGASKEKNNVLTSITLKTEKKQIFEGETYNLFEQYIPGNAFGTLYITGFADISSTTHTQTGELTITQLDFFHNIISGIFYFDILDSNGVIHEIRDGRFDMHFTQ